MTHFCWPVYINNSTAGNVTLFHLFIINCRHILTYPDSPAQTLQYFLYLIWNYQYKIRLILLGDYWLRRLLRLYWILNCKYNSKNWPHFLYNFLNNFQMKPVKWTVHHWFIHMSQIQIIYMFIRNNLWGPLHAKMHRIWPAPCWIFVRRVTAVYFVIAPYCLNTSYPAT